MTGRIERTVGLAMLLAVALRWVGCTTPSTDVLLLVDTDARDRITNLHVTIARGTVITTAATTRSWSTGPAAGDLHMPATFGTVPGDGAARDEVVTMQLEAQFSPVAAGSPVTILRRTVRFSFVPHVTSFVRVFLNTSCANIVAAPSRCASSTLSNCTVQRYCEELTPSQTCGDEASCTDIAVATTPVLADGGIPTGLTDTEVSRDVGRTDARVMDVVAADSVTDASRPVEACVPACGARVCGSDSCGGSCGTCASGQPCDATGRCMGCTPMCAGRVCGSDSCGSTCGSCPAGQNCNAAGRCVCAPNCAGRVCGMDGCGGSCGSCPGAQVCNGAGQCVTSCTPSCAGRSCGTDGCSGSCGTCGASSMCSAAGSCVCAPNCAGRNCGSDGCAGSCGSCGAGQTCNGSGVCACVPDCAGRNCGSDGCGGSCGTCAAPESCNGAGVCMCVPRCLSGCGSDGCGGTCTCAVGSTCMGTTCCVIGASRRCAAGNRCCGVVNACGCNGDCTCDTCACP